MEANRWTVQISTDTLRSAVDKKLAFHKGRLAHWTAETEKLEQKLRSSVEFRAREAAYRTSTGPQSLDAAFAGFAGGVPLDIVTDPQVQRDYNEHCAKMQDHKSRVEQFERWERFFMMASGTFNCDVGDFEAFGL